MIEFLSYVVFLTAGAIFGAVLGVRFMRWHWNGATLSQRETVGFLVTLAIAMSYIAARRYW